AITADDLRALRMRLLARDGLRVAVVGDIDAPTLAASLDSLFGRLPASGDIVPVPDVQPAAGVRVDVPMDIPQAIVLFAGPGISRDDPDFVGPTIADYIYGGAAFTSRLFQEVRARRGLAYSPGSALLQFRHAGLQLSSAAT